MYTFYVVFVCTNNNKTVHIKLTRVNLYDIYFENAVSDVTTRKCHFLSKDSSAVFAWLVLTVRLRTSGLFNLFIDMRNALLLKSVPRAQQPAVTPRQLTLRLSVF